ncbi:uncharacterized protein LOC107039049 [Diachasma alloeum]|uniref:uncharacterized protein LOC107039049 n=1 Tax=Diachasma alloeum TaxID=454923 RepID=UPI0007382B37|nr:uncharacterized protein LOC107039049 [Diachasma alloeum]
MRGVRAYIAARVGCFYQGEMDSSPEPTGGRLGYGCFRAYLHKYKHEDSRECSVCTGVDEDAEHVFFICPRFNEIRSTWESYLGRDVKPQSLVEAMLSSKTAWDATSNFVAEVMKELRNEKRKYKAAV